MDGSTYGPGRGPFQSICAEARPLYLNVSGGTLAGDPIFPIPRKCEFDTGTPAGTLREFPKWSANPAQGSHGWRAPRPLFT